MLDSKWTSNSIVAGAVAGIVFTFFVLLGGITETLGIIPRLESMLLHLIVSIIGGIIFVLILGRLIHSWWSASFLGLLFGIAVWIVGPLTLLPSITRSAPLFSQWTFTAMQSNSQILMGLLIYGIVLGLSYCFLKKGKLHKLKKPKI